MLEEAGNLCQALANFENPESLVQLLREMLSVVAGN